MAQSGLGCAQNSDGSLRDASEIQFFNDVDDEHPISSPSSTRTSSSRSLAPIFTQRVKPVGKVAGSRRPSPRRSSRTSRPSARAADPNNAEASVKRKSDAADIDDRPAAPRKARLLANSTPVDSSDANSEAESDAASMEVDTEAEGDEQDVMDVEHFESIKTMADADHAHVRIFQLSSHFLH